MLNKRIKKLITIAIFICGLAILLYPIIAIVITHFNQTVAITNYEKTISEMTSEEINDAYNKAEEFNENLYENNTFDVSLTEEAVSTINIVDNEALAYIIIPKINLKLPIYEGASEEVLSLGIGHLANTSLPIGGNSTHSVLVGHTGLSNAIMFDNLDKLEIGDKFYIKVLDQTLEYEVSNVNVVLPEETESLIIQENKDLITLVTCTPKHINSHRLLVTGSRVEESNINVTENKITDNLPYNNEQPMRIINIGISILICILFFILFLIFVKHIFNRNVN
jgi:sortase A